MARWSKRSSGLGAGSDGVYGTVSEIGDAENISKSYVSRILRLALLEPDIIAMILEGRSDQVPMLEQVERPLPASWQEQRDAISQTRQSSPGGMAGSAPQIGG
jgi:hypothetical protein